MWYLLKVAKGDHCQKEDQDAGVPGSEPVHWTVNLL